MVRSSILMLALLLQACDSQTGSLSTARASAETAPAGATRRTEAGVDVGAAAATITAEDFHRRLGVVADDSMGGRWTPSPGLEATAGFLADELESMGVRGAMQGSYLQRYSVAIRNGSAIDTVDAPNVVGWIEGSDPRLKSEYVVFSAHMDHVGIGRPDASGDSIYNGADDDGSGTVAVLEIAEAMAALDPAPRRSVMFVWFSGEERGLWGSRYFTANPPVPLGRMVADLNLDMVGRNWSDTIAAIGREQSDLGTRLREVADRHPELDMEPVGDRWPGESFYTRSDHYNFARGGVPILFFFNGTHADYHQPSDELDKVDPAKAVRVAQLVFYLGAEVANSDRRPRWDPESYRQIVQAGR